jgi:hypothetical protein
MKRTSTAVLALLIPAAFLLAPATSWSGPNAGGVLILHALPGVVESHCGFSNIDSCNDANVRMEGGSAVNAWVLAAFPSAGSPRLAGVVFGLHYDENQVFVMDYQACGDFELHDNGWPDPDTGIAITWNEAQTEHLVELLWLSAYGVIDLPGTLDTRGHPQGGGAFADDAIPANIDPIADYGRLGFGTDGYLPCPDATPVMTTTWGSMKSTYREPE